MALPLTTTARNPNLPVEPGVHLTTYGPYRAPPAARALHAFKPLANMRIVHHMILTAGSGNPTEQRPYANAPSCRRGNRIVYAWARTGQLIPEPLELRDAPLAAAAYPVGPGTPYEYFCIQIHYQNFGQSTILDASGVELTFAAEPPAIQLSLLVMMSTMLRIPPRIRRWDECVSCNVVSSGRVVAFRNHAHRLARDIWSDVFSTHGEPLGARGNISAQQAQIFRLLPQPLLLRAGERLELHCEYDSSAATTTTRLGLDERYEEMCNQYFMSEASLQVRCPSTRTGWEATATWSTAWIGALGAYVRSGRAPASLAASLDGVNSRRAASGEPVSSLSQARRALAFARSRPRVASTMPNSARSLSIPKIGQVPAIAAAPSGTLYVLHRGDSNFFSTGHKLPFDPILALSAGSRALVGSMGAGVFTVPHGLSVDYRGHLWATDVGSHQVFEFDPTTGHVVRTLGSGRAGSDEASFNKPTDVAVDADTGEIFVADGYGNSRIVVFAADGRFLRQWGSRGGGHGQFLVPHSLALDGRGHVYVADRENARVQVFSTRGDFEQVWTSRVLAEADRSSWGKHVSSVRYDKVLDLLVVTEGSGVSVRTRGGCTVADGLSDLEWPHAAVLLPLNQTRATDGFVPSKTTGRPMGFTVLVAELEGRRVREFRTQEGRMWSRVSSMYG